MPSLFKGQIIYYFVYFLWVSCLQKFTVRENNQKILDKVRGIVIIALTLNQMALYIFQTHPPNPTHPRQDIWGLFLSEGPLLKAFEIKKSVDFYSPYQNV